MRNPSLVTSTVGFVVAVQLLLPFTTLNAAAYSGGGTLQDPLDSGSVPRFNRAIPTGTGETNLRLIIPFTPTVPDPLDPDLATQANRIGYDRILINNIDPALVPAAGMVGMVTNVWLCPSGIATPADEAPVPLPPCAPLGPQPSPLYEVANPGAGNDLVIQLSNGVRHVGATQVELTVHQPCANVSPALQVQLGNANWGTPPGTAVPDTPVDGLAIALLTLLGTATTIAANGDSTFLNVAAGTATTLAVIVRNACLTPVQGVPIAWAATAGGGSIVPSASVTDVNGIAQASLTTGSTPGVNTAIATNPTVTASQVTFTVNTIVGPLATVKVLDGNACDALPAAAVVMSTDQTHVFHAFGFDAAGNCRGAQSVDWTVGGGIGTVTPTTGTSTTFDAKVLGTGKVIAAAGGAIPVAESGPIEVRAGLLKTVIIRDMPNGGGVPVDTVTLNVNGVANWYAAGYDNDNQFIADQVVSWSVTNNIGTFNPGAGPTAAFRARNVGTGIATADHGDGIKDVTGLITVLA